MDINNCEKCNVIEKPARRLIGDRVAGNEFSDFPRSPFVRM